MVGENLIRMSSRSAGQVSGHVRLVKRKRGDQWYVKYRSRAASRSRSGLARPGRAEWPPAGHYTRKTAEAELDAILTDARRGELPDPGARAATFGDAVAEWLLRGAREGAKPSTLRDYRNAANGA